MYYSRWAFSVVCAAFILFFGTLAVSGALTSGYHFVDDHWVLQIDEYMKEGHSCIETMQWMVMGDLSIRFRPLYNVVIVMQTCFLGTDMNKWIVLVMLEGVLSFILFYDFARRLEISSLFAFGFAGIIFFGEQFTPWYRALNQENFAMLLLGIALCSLLSKSPKGLFFTGIFAILASLQKESFCLLLPVYPLLYYFLEKRKLQTFSPKDYIRRHPLFIGILLCTFLAEIYCIVFVVGMNRIGYAGLDSHTPLSVYGKNLYFSMRHLYYFLPLTLLSGAILWRRSREHKDYINEYYGLLCCGGYIMLTQLVLHAKSGIWERYLLPFTVGYGLLFVLLPLKVDLHGKIRNLFAVVLAAMLCIAIVKSYKVSESWANAGHANQMLLETVTQHLEKSKAKRLLFYIDGSELDAGATIWLKYFVSPELDVTIHKRTKVQQPHSNQGYDIIVFSLDKENDHEFFDAYGIERNHYRRSLIGDKQNSYVLMSKKEGK